MFWLRNKKIVFELSSIPPLIWHSVSKPVYCLKEFCLQQEWNPGPEVIKLFFMLNSTEHEIFPAIVGILTFMSGKNSFLGLSEP